MTAYQHIMLAAGLQALAGLATIVAIIVGLRTMKRIDREHAEAVAKFKADRGSKT